jgi:hypothetical protein
VKRWRREIGRRKRDDGRSHCRVTVWPSSADPPQRSNAARVVEPKINKDAEQQPELARVAALDRDGRIG